MFHATMRSVIDSARTLAQLDSLSRTIWQAHAAETVTDAEAQGLAEALHTRRAAIREAVAPVGIPLGRVTLFPPKRLQRAPERSVAIERRRRLACSGPMPPALASRFTAGQLAVLRIVGDEVARNGACGLPIDALAARAGVSRRLAQAAIRLAEGDGLLTIQERRHQGRKNDPNVLRIISREWLQWLRRGGRSAAPALLGSIGCKNLHPTDKRDPQNQVVDTEPKKGCRGAAVDFGRSDPVRILAGGRTGRAMR
ncbi:hypothetical protein LOK46_32740 (plasmid) [Methylobacterium sp. NMS14P]|uniref:hypothetical protein n=1 Tax=Methylobacterium sp. NMS14P TaxID=2894310 RepID=UPI002359C3C8|nr:hypothetical protein [Methylobacterium sp. NMS14P]WCS28878.1 hypothetical protein LOK46_32740 [Methylobacterium sp. NMS14P]